MTHEQIGAALGKSRSAVRNRCHRIGLVDKSSDWSPSEIELLKSAYARASTNAELDLAGLASTLGRAKSNVSRKARLLGLTDQGRKDKASRKVRRKFATNEEAHKHVGAMTKKRIAEQGHPRGTLGMRHTAESLGKIALASKRNNALRTPEMLVEINLKAMQTKLKNGTYAPPRQKTTWKAGWREIGGVRKYYRSKWEANYAHYLQWLKEKGQIADWKHEPKVFWFEGVKRGTVSYLPDFWVLENGGSDSFHEVKGWMDDRSVTKIKRMKKYYPNVKLVVVDSKGYEAIKKTAKDLVPGWEA